MKPTIETTMNRAEEILGDLMGEYQNCLDSKQVSDRASQLTHDVCEKLRSVLDRTARQYWEKHISPELTERERERASVYFPVAPHQNGFDSILGRWCWQSVRAKHQDVYDYLLAQQPFSNAANGWISSLNDLAVTGKHIDLVPQVRREERRVTVSRDGGSVSWGSGVSFGKGVSVMGAQIDPVTQRIVPTPGVTEKIEVWVSFIIDGYNVNAAAFCRDACDETKIIAIEMDSKFSLS